MRRKFWYWGLGILCLLAIAGLLRLRFDVDVLNLLPKELPVVQGLELYQRHFTDSRELIITIKSPDAAATEAAAGKLAESLRSAHQSRRVCAFGNLPGLSTSGAKPPN